MGSGSRSQGPLIVVGVTVIQAAGATGPAIQNTKFVLDSVIECNGANGSVAIGRVDGGYVARTYAKGCDAVVDGLVYNNRRTAAGGYAQHADADAAVSGGTGAPSTAVYTVANEVASGSLWWDGEFPDNFVNTCSTENLLEDTE